MRNKNELLIEADEHVNSIYELARNQNGMYTQVQVKQAYIAGKKSMQKENTELKKQIEKMKNWCNCKNYQQCLIELAEQGKVLKPSESCRNCKKWEIKENDKI